MKFGWFLVAFVFAGSGAHGQGVTIEPGAAMSDKVSQSMIGAAVAVIRLNGYSCDTVSSVIPFLMSEGLTVRCNGYRYAYELANKGGKILVTVK
jgi:hypothetical protein